VDSVIKPSNNQGLDYKLTDYLGSGQYPWFLKSLEVFRRSSDILTALECVRATFGSVWKFFYLFIYLR